MAEEMNDGLALRTNSFENSHSFANFALKIVKESIFGGFCCLSIAKKKTVYNLSIQKFVKILKSIIIFLQISRLNWKIDADPENQKLEHWKILGYASFDQIFVDFGNLSLCFIGFSIIVWICTLFIVIFSLMSHYKKNISEYLTFFPKLLVIFLATIGYIPFLLIFLLTIKYSVKDQNIVEEFWKCENCNLNLGAFGILSSIFSLICLVAISYGEKIFCANLRHSFKNQNLSTKSHSTLSIQTNLFYFAVVIVYVFFNSYSDYPHQYLLIIYPVILIYKYIKYIPFYNSIVNETAIAKNAGIALTAGIFLFGNIVGNDYITIWLFWIAMPINTYFILYFAKNKIRLNLGKSKETMKNQYEVEWFLRSKLSAKGDFDATDILKKFSGSLEIEGFYSDKLFTVWEAYYCIDVLSDERLARIKLNKAVSMRSTLEGDFQVWKCKILLEEHSIGFYEDISTLYYILQLENIKKKDEILCNKFLDFWAEITSDKPMMAKLQHFSGEISRKLDEVKKGYSDLVKSFPNNIYCHELYGSLLMDILKNNEIGFKLLSRKNGLMSIQKEASKSKFWKFSEINGFLIVSANPELFGTIIYANLPAGQILSQPVSRIIGSKLSSYIPEPFSEQHDKYLKKFLSNCTNPDVEPKMSYFLKNERGYLVGCDFKITLISLVEHIYFFISLNPNVKHREFALVSDYGQIYAYSELFPQIIGNNKISLANQFADKIIPGVECLAMKPLEPLLISINSKEILLVKITHIVLKSSFTFLVLIDDYSEIEAWKRGEDTIQKRENKYKNENNLTNDVKKNKSLSRSPKNHHRLSAFYSVAEIGYTIENEKNKEQENIKTPFTAAESTLAYNAGLGISQITVKESENMLRFFKWILLFSILAIISMNIIILTYINQQITHSNDLTTVKDIAGIMQEISVEAYLSYTIDLCHIHSTLNCSYYKDQLSASLERLRALQLTIIDDYSKWSYCAHSTIVTEEIVPVYNPDQSDYVTFLNLYGFVSEILKHGYSFLNEADYSKNQSYDELFLINNGLGGASIMLNSSFQGLLNCETERLNQNENITMIFVYASQIFVWILSLIFVIFSFKFNKLHDKLWNYIQKQANSTYFELHQACTNRLSSFHNYSSDQEELEIKKRKNPKPFILKTKLYIKFTCICSVIVIVTSVYYFSIEFIFYPSCRENLLKRYLLFEAFLYRVPVISEIIFWTINLAYHGGESVQKINGLEYPFQASGIMLESAIYRFNLLSSIIVNPSNYGMYSDDIKFKFFEGNTNPDPVYAQGTFMAAGVLLMDANYISYTNSNDISTLLPKFIQRWITFQAMVLSRISIIDNDSKIYVQNQLNTVFLATFLFSGTCFGLYFFLYLPFIRIEKRKLRKLKEISAMIPQAFDMKFKRNN